MNILHINCNYTGNHVHRNMIKSLSYYKEINNKVFVPVHKNIDEKFDENVEISKCFNKIDRISFYYKSKKIQRCIIKKYNFSKINIIHAYTLFTDGNVAYNMKKEYNIPYVVAVRNTDVNTFFKYRFYLRKLGVKIMKEADAIFFLSNSYKKEVLEKYVSKKDLNIIKTKVHIIPNGIDDYWLSNKKTLYNEKKSKNIKVVYAGRIDANKNIITTQKALKSLRDKNYKVDFTIVGKVENRNIFKKIMKYENTTYFGNKSKEELINIYRKNDIFVMPSFKESFGLVYAEAMSQGLPVIYTKGQGFDEQFEDGLVGYAVDPINYEEIAKRIIDVINNYKKIQKECIERVEQFKWKEICKRYYYIYNQILGADKNLK